MISPEMLDHYRTIIVRPVVTEKSMAQTQGTQKRNKYTFIVRGDANKTEIGHAVSALWNVRVVRVNTLTVKGKERRQSYKYRPGKTAERKKAIVTLAEGHSIDVIGT
jgi:large subunit ribosomal protein L23